MGMPSQSSGSSSEAPSLPADVLAQANKIQPQMENLKGRYTLKTGQGQVVAMKDEGLELLRSVSLMTRGGKKLVNKQGFHPRNRSCRGVIPSEVPKKLETFKATGFSPDVCKPIVAGRVPGDIGDKYESLNQTVCNPNCHLATVLSGSLDSFTLTCNHSVQALKLANERGGVTTGEHSKLADAIMNGVAVDDVHWLVEVLWPWMIDLIIEADNVTYQTAACDSAIDLTMKVQSLSRELVNDDGSPDWTAIESRIKRTELRRVEEIPFYIEFVKKHCIENQNLLAHVDEYAKTLEKVQEVPSAALAKLAGVWLGPIGCPEFIEAVYKACICAPEKYIQNGVNTYMAQGDATGLGNANMLKFVQMGDLMLSMARSMASKENVPSAREKDVANMLDKLGVKIAAHIFKRPILGQYVSLNAIVGSWYADMEVLLGGMKTPLPDGWSTSERAPKPKQQLSIKRLLGKQPKQIASAITLHFKSRGVEVGSLVVEKVSKVKYEVLKIKDDKITMKSRENSEEREAGTNMFFALYDKVNVVKEDITPPAHIYIYICLLYIYIHKAQLTSHKYMLMHPYILCIMCGGACRK